MSSRLRSWAGPAALAAALCAVGVAAFFLPRGLAVDLEDVLRSTRALGPTGWVAFVVLQTLVALSGVLPASLLGVVAGATYGLGVGFALAAVSTTVGALAAFAVSRSLFRAAVERRLRGRRNLVDLDRALARDGWKLVCLLRVSPIMPFAATSYALGLSSIGLRDYLIGTSASLPALFGYVVVGELAGVSLSAWHQHAGWFTWVLLGGGAVATVAATLHVGRIAARAGLVRPAAADSNEMRAGTV